MDITPEQLTEAFKVAQAARESLEKPSEPEKPELSAHDQYMKETLKGSKLAEVKNISEEFNKSDNQKDNSDATRKGKGSDMVEKDQPTLELKPKPKSREAIDRETHKEKMSKDDSAAREHALKLAEQLQQRDDFGHESQHDLGLGR